MSHILVTIAAVAVLGFIAATSALLVQRRASRQLRGQVEGQKRIAEVARAQLLVAEAAAAERDRTSTETTQAAYSHIQMIADELQHFVSRRLPAAVDLSVRQIPRVEVPGLAYPALRGSKLERTCETILSCFAAAVDETRASVGASARAGLRMTTSDAQSLLAQCQIFIEEELSKDGSDAHTQWLMDLDHRVTLALHAMQRLRVLTGSWPGMQRANAPFGDIVESAKGRLRHYSRVDYVYDPTGGEVLVEGGVVEPITLALTEFLSNALTCTPARVVVSVDPVANGYTIIVDDRGVGMNHFQREEATDVLTQARVIDLTNITSPSLGFAIIGKLAHDYGFTASIASRSPYGGLSTVIFVPNDLLTETKASDGATAPAAVTGARSLPGIMPAAPPEPAAIVPTDMPRRRRRQPARQQQPVQDDTPDPLLTDSRDLGAGLARFAQAMQDAPSSPDDDPREGTPHHA